MNDASAGVQARRAFAHLLFFAATLTSSELLAQQPRDEARDRFNQALRLVDAQRFEEAAVEFKRAYELSPNPAVLYNLGQAHAAARHPAQAVAAFRAYLSQTTDSGDVRRGQALAELTRLEQLLGVLVLSTRPSNVSVRVDGRPVEVSGPLELDPGSHLIVVSSPGYAVAEREVLAVSGSSQTWELELSVLSIPTLPADATSQLTPTVPVLPTPAAPPIAPPVAPQSARAAAPGASDSSKRRVWLAATTAGAGLLLGGVAVGLAVDSSARSRTWSEEQARLDQRWRSAPADAQLLERQQENDASARHIKFEDEATVGVAVASAACLVGAALIWWLSDSPSPAKTALTWSPRARTGTLSMAW